MTTTHRHHDYVDHTGLDHNHGACTEHAHWAGGTHDPGISLEVSAPENDPVGHIPDDAQLDQIIDRANRLTGQGKL